LQSDRIEKIHVQKSRKKKQAWFLLNPFLVPEDVSIGGNGICFVIQRMGCIGGISILFEIYGMWWNLNPTCNIFCLYSALVQ
jgi:hypothetical protein